MLIREELDGKYSAWLERIEKTHGGANHRTNPEPWFCPLSKPLSQSTMALLTTAGAYCEGQEPYHVETRAGDASIRIIPDDTDLNRIRFAHTHYDTVSAEQDPNVVFPIDRLHEFVDEGRVGAASRVHVGMMGFNPDPTLIADQTAPQVAARLGDAGVDVAVLTPG